MVSPYPGTIITKLLKEHLIGSTEIESRRIVPNYRTMLFQFAVRYSAVRHAMA